ncbi:hypothetical protein SDC9_143449 [bioreactor metagenome]|uniref:Uncharacterized protein n=1 Tax=bioreactor metagenome TaxID=1076179 RepID=A0A645E402_9ZZZZ
MSIEIKLLKHRHRRHEHQIGSDRPFGSDTIQEAGAHAARIWRIHRHNGK